MPVAAVWMAKTVALVSLGGALVRFAERDFVRGTINLIIALLTFVVTHSDPPPLPSGAAPRGSWKPLGEPTGRLNARGLASRRRGRNVAMSTTGRDPLSPGLDLIRRGFAELLRALAAMIDPGRESKVIEQRKKPDDST